MNKKNKIIIGAVSAAIGAAALGVGLGLGLNPGIFNTTQEAPNMTTNDSTSATDDGRETVTAGVLVISSTTTEISPTAYQNKGITSLTLPALVARVGAGAFTGNSGLVTVRLSQTLYNTLSGSGNYQAKKTALDAIFGSQVITYQSIDSSTAYTNHVPSQIDNGQTNVNNGQLILSNVVTQVIANAYQNKGITSLTIPALVVRVGAGAFTGNSGLVTVRLSQTLYNTLSGSGNYQDKKAALDAIFGSQVTTYQSIDSSTTYTDHVASQIDNGQTNVNNGQLILSNVVTQVIANAYQNRGITSLTVPTSVTMVGEGAFTNNVGLLTVNLSKALYDTLSGSGNYQAKKTALDAIFGPQVIAYQSLDGTAQYVDHQAPVTDDGRETITAGKLVISSVTTEISSNAYQNKGITSLTLPALVARVGTGAFTGNSGLVTVRLSQTLYNTLSGIGNYQDKKAALDAIFGSQVTTYQSIDSSTTYTDHVASQIDNGQTNVINGQLTLLDIVTEVATNAYQNKGIISLTIPTSVTMVGAGAFTGNNGLTTVGLSQALYNTLSGSGNYQDKKAALDAIFGPQVTTYQSIDSSTTYTAHNPSATDNGQTNVNNGQLTLLDIVTEVATNAYQNKGIISLIIPTSVTMVGAGAFTGNNGLTTVRLSKALYDTLSGSGNYQAKKTALDAIFGSQVATYQSIDAITSYTDHTSPAIDNGQTSINSGELVIPDKIIEIAANAYQNKGIISLTLPASVTKVGIGAFLTNKLTSVTIPDSVITIEESAFSKNQLETLVIGNSLVSIGKEAFLSNKIKDLIIPDSVITIGDGAFVNNQLESLSLGNSITSIGSGAFYNNKLKNLIIPDSVITINLNAFSRNELTSLAIGSSVTSIGKEAFSNNQLASLTIPDSVITIGDGAFVNNQIKDPLIIGSSVTTIGEAAFQSNQLTSLTIPASVTSLGNSAFAGNSLKTVKLTKALYNKIVNSQGFLAPSLLFNVFGGNVTYEDLNTPTMKFDSPMEGAELTIPNTVKEINKNAFNRNKLASLIIPDSVTTIGQAAFQSNQLTSLTIPDSVTTIGEAAFQFNRLTSLTLGSALTSIGKNAFGSNRIMGNLTIPKSVTSIGEAAFQFNQLTSVTILDSVATIGKDAFANNQLTSISLGNSVTSIGEGAFQENKLTSVTIPKSVTSIADSAFTFNDNLSTVKLSEMLYNSIANSQGFPAPALLFKVFGENITYENIDDPTKNFVSPVSAGTLTIPDTVTTIQNGAFSSSKLASIVLPNSVTSIGEHAFSFNQLTSLTLGDMVATIGNSAFFSNQLADLTIPSSVTSIGDLAFQFNKLTTLNLANANSLTTIGLGAFANNQLASIIIPSSVTSIGVGAFNSNLLTTLTIPDSVISIGRASFQNNQLTTVNLTNANSLVTIGDFAFQSNSMTSLMLGSSVTTIGVHAFSFNQLTAITIPDSVTSIGASGFYDNKLTSLTIPSSVTSIGPFAFQNNPNLNTVTLTKILFDKIANSDPDKSASESLSLVFGSQVTRYVDISDSTKTFPST